MCQAALASLFTISDQRLPAPDHSAQTGYPSRACDSSHASKTAKVYIRRTLPRPLRASRHSAATAPSISAATITSPTGNPFVGPGNAAGQPLVFTVSASGYTAGDQVFIAGDCAGLYISNGEDLSPDPTQVRKRGSWTPIERGRPYVTELDLTFSEAAKDLTEPVPLMSIGKDQLVARVAGVRANGKLQVGFQHYPAHISLS